MPNIRHIESRYVMQYWVGLLSGLVCFAVASINAVVVAQTGTPILAVFVQPSVYFILAIAVLFFISSSADSRILRGIQIGAYFLAALFTVAGEEPGNLTGFLFAIYALLLYNEYGPTGTRLRSSLILAGFYIALAVILADRASSHLFALAVLVFVLGVMAMYALVIYRQIRIRHVHVSELEDRVAERTAELKQQAKVLEDQTQILERTVVERDTLIQEMHHRIGNSLQLLASYVGLQQDKADDRNQEILLETETRIHAVAQVHMSLHDTHQLESLPIDQYTYELAADLQAAYHQQGQITVSSSTNLEARLDFVLPFALILNELIINAIKYGKTESQPALVHVRSWTHSARFETEVRDRGPGFPDHQAPGLGSEVVNELVRQNYGTVSRTNSDGAVVRLSFPVDQVSRGLAIRPSARASRTDMGDDIASDMAPQRRAE